MKKLKQLPKFKSKKEEREFWQSHDSADYVDWDKAKPVQFPKLKPSTKTISLRIPEALLNDIKILANKEDVPYQSLIKILLSAAVRKANQK